MTKNIKVLYSIRFKLNAGLIYSIASCYIYSLIIFDMLSFIQMDLCRISGGQTGVSITSWHKNSLLMYILHQEGSFSITHFLRTCSLYFWNSHIQLITFCSAQRLHPSYACRFLRLLICQSVPHSGYKCVKFAETSSVRLFI